MCSNARPQKSRRGRAALHCIELAHLARAVLRRRGPAAGGESQAENVNWQPCGPFLAASLPPPPPPPTCPICPLTLSSSSRQFLNSSFRIVSIIQRGISLASTFPLKSFPAPTKIHFSHEIWRASLSSNVPVTSKFSEKSSFASSFQKKPSNVFGKMNRKGLDFKEFVQRAILILIGGNCRDALLIGGHSLLPPVG